MSGNTNAPQVEKVTKEEKEFQDTFQQVLALLQGNTDILSGKEKISKDVTAQIVEEILKEKGETLKKNFKTKLEGIIAQYIQMQREIAAKKRELAKLELDKKKEFVKSAKEVFGSVQDFQQLVKDYGSALGTVVSSPSEEETDNSTEEQN